MKIYIRLAADLLVEYVCRGARNGLARISTHEKRIEKLALEHYKMSPAVFSVLICPEDTQKEEVLYTEKPEYYIDGSILCAYFVPRSDELEEEDQEEDEA